MSSCSQLIFWSACMIMLVLTCTFSGCTSTHPVQTIPSATPAPPERLNTIAIKNFSFNPENLTITTGTTVTWLNQDEAIHQIDSDAKVPVAFSSDSLAHGASFQFTFTRLGTFTYHCTYHPTMKGTVIVES